MAFIGGGVLVRGVSCVVWSSVLSWTRYPGAVVVPGVPPFSGRDDHLVAAGADVDDVERRDHAGSPFDDDVESFGVDADDGAAALGVEAGVDDSQADHGSGVQKSSRAAAVVASMTPA